MKILVEHNPPESRLTELNVRGWPIWCCGVSEFPWAYDTRETCYLLEGDVTVTPDGGSPVTFGAGDLLIFPAGLSCRWQVRTPVRKHYSFG